MLVKTLYDLNIILTRPQHQSANLTCMLENLGGHAISIPSIAIQGIDISHVISKYHIKTTDLVIFLSANAAFYSQQLWLALKNKPLFIAIGPGTAATLQNLNLNVFAIPHEFNSEGLLQLPILQQVQNKIIYLCTGENPRPLLADTLCARGATLIPIVCYRRNPTVEPKTLNLSQYSRIDMTVTTSEEGLRNWHKMLMGAKASWLLNVPTLVINPAHVATAKHLGFREIIVAANASDQAILDKLIEWHTNAADASH
jgi:uroporphyrinogen-III synthase